MKAKFYLINIIAGLLISFTLFSQSPVRFSEPAVTRALSPQNHGVVSDNWFSNASTWIHGFEYGFHKDSYDAYRTVNTASKIAFRISKDGYTAYSMRLEETVKDWEVHIGLQAVSRNEHSSFFRNMVSVEQSGGVLKQHFGFADVEYRNDEKGLRQNFIINERPAGEGDLKLKLTLQSTLQAKILNGQSLVFESRSDGEKKLIYEDLSVWDARHLSVNAHMELDKKGRVLSLVIDDKDALYPITIDPINKSPDWISSADGLLPALLTNLQLQVQTLYGYTVTGLGDVNGDTFDDVAVSAPTMANVVSGSGALLGVGAVFVYFGSAAGLPAQPNHVLQPSVLIGGGLFGLSVSAGDVVGTAAPDIIVGAPLETVTLNFGLAGILSGKVGQVHIYNGADLTGPLNPSATITVSLSTSQLTAATITLNSLLGFSVAATGDMNGDGKGEVIAGAPTFARLSGLVNVKTGGAFVFLSGGFTTIRSLDPPTGSVLGLSGAVQAIVEALPAGPALWSVASILLTPLLNGQIEGLLFGYSVENAGPYTSDAISDVIVGAPAGVNLGDLTSGLSLAGAVSNALSGQILGGSAYVFAGNGVLATGVATTAAARLQAASTGLLSNAANLFGYSIRGVEGTTGIKNGNVLVGAPVSSVLSNIVGGLQLKTGTLSVFAKQTGAISSPVAPLQTISSPRSAALLGLLTGQGILNVSALYGASMDNLMDVNCDGTADIIVGEPLSTNIPLIGLNAVGGAAYVLLGRPDGTYTPYQVWELTNTGSPLLGVNATALLGWSVAGAGHTWGPGLPVRSIVGGPANSLDFGAGLLNLGNTVGTLVGFVADANGIGKAYSFNADLCGIVTLPATLISFKGDKIDNTVGLEWLAVDEKDLSHYEVERSTDGANFTTMDKVTAKDLQRVTYKWPDMRPVYGNNYYRLRIVDDNGKFTYSGTIVVQFNRKSQGMLTVAPNPAIQQISVRLEGYEKGEYTLRLYNTAGILFETRKVNLREHQQTEILNRSRNLVPGVYMVTLHDENNNKQGTVRVIFNAQ